MAMNFGPTYPPMFPQPNGNVYTIQNSLEVANIPAGAGITAAICLQENLLYLKTIQNGVPTFLAYKITPYTETPRQTIPVQENTLETRLATIEKQLEQLIKGGKNSDDELSKPSATTTATSWD